MKFNPGDFVKIKKDAPDSRNLRGRLLHVEYQTSYGIVRVRDVESTEGRSFLVFNSALELIKRSGEAVEVDELDEATKKWRKYFGRNRGS